MHVYFKCYMYFKGVFSVCVYNWTTFNKLINISQLYFIVFGENINNFKFASYKISFSGIGGVLNIYSVIV